MQSLLPCYQVEKIPCMQRTMQIIMMLRGVTPGFRWIISRWSGSIARMTDLAILLLVLPFSTFG
jgi:hypothetical protein